jgi:integrase
VANAAILRRHLPPVLLSKPVAMLTAREVRAFRDSLLEKGLKRSTCNRYLKSFVAALTLAANDDDRITNRKVWKLAALREAANPRNIILTDQQVRDVVAASYQTGERFGAYVELLAVTGTRPSQARRLTVADLEADHPGGPRVQMPNSRKGKGRKRGERVTLPIPAGLARRLQAEAVGRTDNEPLLRDDAGNAWTTVGHRQPFMAAAAAAGLPKYVTAYALRHSSITRSLLRGVPVRLVSAAHDTSVAMVEATYSKYIAHPGADLMRGAMIDFDEPAPAAAKVVSLARAKAAG